MAKLEHLVLGATGKTGRRLVRRLRQQGEAVRPVSRGSAIRFDWDDRTTWGTALSGASTVYLVVPDDPDPIEDFVRQAVTEGVRRFVVLSGRGIELEPDGFPGMWTGEQAVRHSGVEWTILRANNFLQNLSEDMWLDPIRSGGLALPTADASDPFVDVDDVAAVAAAALTEEGHQGRIHELSGREAMSLAELVALVAREIGRELLFQDLTPEEYADELRSAGFPEEAVRALDRVFAVLRSGVAATPTGTVREILGRDPIAPETYVATTAATGLWN